MVFERNHEIFISDNAVGAVAGSDSFNNGYYNNTNASAYINSIRMEQMRKEIISKSKNDNSGDGYFFDPPPLD